jgi:hypothetical protein
MPAYDDGLRNAIAAFFAQPALYGGDLWAYVDARATGAALTYGFVYGGAALPVAVTVARPGTAAPAAVTIVRVLGDRAETVRRGLVTSGDPCSVIAVLTKRDKCGAGVATGRDENAAKDD